MLLHLDRDELAAVLARVHDALRPTGVLACTVKEGDGEEVHSRKLGLPRRFTYWRPAPLRTVLQGAAFDVLSIERSHGEVDDRLQVLVRRAA
ncbi:class I SAM-dependent methyltransferase [Amnibacterium setariae]|uniref:Class I SAM-dependent methyltransferase n=1 Tax=Amnibacterium setariae TaxID=2306585 RepID=A0A3A1TTF9_9MICO|nr:hypothetical protein [Amnibacterium setariae]RIX27513.1 hypothetical protein D1781_07970 [Amnibacterium setariae]